MFSVREKRMIAEAVQQILRSTGHPELPKHGEIEFLLRVKGAEEWSVATIANNGAVANPTVNLHNEAKDQKRTVDLVRFDGAAGKVVKALKLDEPDKE